MKLSMKAVLALLAANAAAVSANGESSVSLQELQSFWVDAQDVIDDLDSYAALWVRPHSCVWSECAVDDTDDGYMGDNRDGDEQWYQYRTQGFCANAAYSLYGVKKVDSWIPSLSCGRSHFINSFFTYGGADTLLNAVGKTPVSYNGNSNDDDSYYSVNAQCSELNGYGGDDVNGDRRELGGDDSGYGATLGCSTDGKYVVAAFSSNSCDGNYYTGVIDEFKQYNKQHSSIGCHKIYGLFSSSDNIVNLLSNSWSCDLRLYPNGCPDPYGKKKNFDFAMRTIAKGGNPYLAYKNMVLQAPIHFMSWIFFTIALFFSTIAYLIKNEKRAMSKGGKNIAGFSRCFLEDITFGCFKMRAQLKRAARGASKKRSKSKSKRKSKSKSKSRSRSRSKKVAQEPEQTLPEVTVTERGDNYTNIEDGQM